MSRLQEINEQTPKRIPVRKCSGCGATPRFDQKTVTRGREDGTATIDHVTCAPQAFGSLDERREASNARVERGV